MHPQGLPCTPRYSRCSPSPPEPALTPSTALLGQEQPQHLPRALPVVEGRWQTAGRVVGFLQAPGAGRGCRKLCHQPERRAGVPGCGAPRWRSTSCAPRPPRRDRGEGRWRRGGGRSPRPPGSSCPLPCAQSPPGPWTRRVLSIHLLGWSVAKRRHPPGRAPSPHMSPHQRGGGGGVQPPGNLWTREGRWGRSHKRLQRGTMRGTPAPHGGTSKVGRRGSRPGGRAWHRQDEVNWEGFRSGGLTLKPDVPVCSPFPLLGPQGVSLGSSGGASSWRVQALQRGGQGDTGGEDECAGSWALLRPSCCWGHCPGHARRVQKWSLGLFCLPSPDVGKEFMGDLRPPAGDGKKDGRR